MCTNLAYILLLLAEELLLFLDHVSDSFDHAVSMLPGFIVGIPNNAKALRGQILTSLRIVRTVVIVRITVDLDHQPQRDADEVHDVRTDRLLSSEPNTESVALDASPDHGFVRGHILAILAR